MENHTLKIVALFATEFHNLHPYYKIFCVCRVTFFTFALVPLYRMFLKDLNRSAT